MFSHHHAYLIDFIENVQCRFILKDLLVYATIHLVIDYNGDLELLELRRMHRRPYHDV